MCRSLRQLDHLKRVFGCGFALQNHLKSINVFSPQRHIRKVIFYSTALSKRQTLFFLLNGHQPKEVFSFSTERYGIFFSFPLDGLCRETQCRIISIFFSPSKKHSSGVGSSLDGLVEERHPIIASPRKFVFLFLMLLFFRADPLFLRFTSSSGISVCRRA